MRNSSKGSSKRSLASALAAGSTILALVLAPVSAAYLFQTSVIAQGVRGGSQQGPQRGGQPDFSKEIAAAQGAADLLAKFEVPKSEGLTAAQADFDAAQADVEEINASMMDLRDSLMDLTDRTEIAQAAKDMKELQAKLKVAKKAVTTAKKALTTAMKPLKNVRKAADKVRSALSKGRVPQDQIDGLSDFFADAMACSQPSGNAMQQGMGPQPFGSQGMGPQSAPQGMGPQNFGGESEGDCSSIVTSLEAAKTGLADFISERSANQADMSQDMNQDMKQEQQMMPMQQDSSKVRMPTDRNQAPQMQFPMQQTTGNDAFKMPMNTGKDSRGNLNNSTAPQNNTVNNNRQGSTSGGMFCMSLGRQSTSSECDAADKAAGRAGPQQPASGSNNMGPNNNVGNNPPPQGNNNPPPQGPMGPPLN